MVVQGLSESVHCATKTAANAKYQVRRVEPIRSKLRAFHQYNLLVAFTYLCRAMKDALVLFLVVDVYGVQYDVMERTEKEADTIISFAIRQM